MGNGSKGLKEERMFEEERRKPIFRWEMLGNIAEERPNLGQTTEVAVYRLMQFTLRDVLIKEYGVASADRTFFEAGANAGKHLYGNLITKREKFSEFISELQETLKRLRIGILRAEKADTESPNFTITVAENLDCSGLAVNGEEICTYDEGFIAGLLFAHTNQEFVVNEADCWCSGGRVCRFEAMPT
jgi:predicted hydrocarbon binding protein